MYKQKETQKGSIHIFVVDVHAYAHTALREVWLPCELKHMWRTVSVDIIMLNTTRDRCVCLPSICLPKVIGVERALRAYGKTNKSIIIDDTSVLCDN